MKSKTTAIWFMIAVTLAAAIWIVNNYFETGVPGAKPVFAGLHAGRVTDLQISPAGAREISVLRTNQLWQLDKPFAYPAQAAAVEVLLGALERLSPVVSISAGEMNGRKNADAEFGFDNPQYRVDVAAGEQNWHLVVGNKTAPGDGVYVRVVGATGALVTDTTWLKSLPHDANDWRDTTLVDMPAAVDWLVVTNGTQAIELRRDVTNRLWRMVRPLSSRANNLLILSALDQLRSARVSRFVSDDPKADLAGYGLEPASLDVWLGNGTNLLTAIHAGKDVNGTPGEMFARREGWNTVVSTAKEPLALWRSMLNDFRDPNLLELTQPVAEIEVRGDSTNLNFTLQQHGSNVWTLAGEKFALDADQVKFFINTLSHLRITRFVQDVVTASGLQTYGLAAPPCTITLRGVAGNTNSVITQLLFGGTTTNEIYVKRGDEDFVYALSLVDLSQLALSGGDCFRARPIWSFSETNVAQVTVQQNGKSRQMVRTGTNQWTLASGEGIINPPEIEETMHQLGNLSALYWYGRRFSDADAGVTTNSLSVSVELKSGEKHSVVFGLQEPLPSLHTQAPVAVVTLEGERWAFIFPPVLYGLVDEALAIQPALSK